LRKAANCSSGFGYPSQPFDAIIRGGLAKAALRRAILDQDDLVAAVGTSARFGRACKANQRKKLERLCRYITRPAIAEQRLSLASNGNVIVGLKTPYDDGTTHVVLNPLEFIGRLAALVPRPRVNLTRFHGGFSSNSKLRNHVVPQQPEVDPIFWTAR